MHSHFYSQYATNFDKLRSKYNRAISPHMNSKLANFTTVYGKIFNLLLFGIIGFICACLFFIQFGKLTWISFWGISRIVAGILLFMTLIKVIIRLFGN